MDHFDLVIIGKIVDADRVTEEGWLGVRDGKIAARGTGPAPSAQASCTG